MATRYAAKYCRTPYPQATRIKNIELFAVLITEGGRFGTLLPQDKFSCFAGGDDYFYWEEGT